MNETRAKNLKRSLLAKQLGKEFTLSWTFRVIFYVYIFYIHH
jgi:hypothetical protein